MTTDSRRERFKSPQTKLWLQVLQLAVIDAFAAPGKNGVTVREAVEAQRWLTRGGDDLALVCEAVNLDPGMVETWAADMAAQAWPRHRYVVWKRIASAMKRGDKI
jgi:hypothetical protein